MPSRAKGPRVLHDDLGIHGLPGDVSPWDIRFDPDDRAFLDRDSGGAFRLRVWAEPNLSDAGVIVRRAGRVFEYRMDLVVTTLRFRFWELVADLEPGDEFSLAFLNPHGRGVYRVPAGITNAVERLDRWVLADLAPLDVPGWSQGAVIYQIFPDRFANGDQGNDPPDVDPWGSPARARRFQGGDLQGITAHLDYLSRLGVDLIYLNPVFRSPSTHRYDAVDYHTVDPILGGNSALVELVNTAHERAIKVVLDASFNHCHPGFFAFQDLIKHGRRSRYWDWFVVYDWPVRIKARKPLRNWEREWLPVWAAQTGLEIDFVTGPGPPVEPTYECWYGVATMPRVNLANPEARGYMLDVAAEWVREPGIDGWRMDVARYVDPDFWNEFRTVVKEADPEAYLMGEFMGDAGEWLQGDRFDATMNYTFRDICLRFFARGEIDGFEATDGLGRLWAQYAWPVTLANQNLIGSHDTARFLTASGGEQWRLRLATILQLTYPGAPGLYYGDEIGMAGTNDPGSRGAFRWEPDPTAHPLFKTIASLTRVRRKHPALIRGTWRPLPAPPEALAFERRLDRSRLAVVINRGRRRNVELPAGGKVVWGQATIDGSRLTVAAHDAAVVKLGKE